VSDIDVREARAPDEVWAAIDLRREVFVGEQGVPIAEELDGQDDRAVHLVAVRDGRVDGTCRLHIAGDRVKLARMAVRRAARRQGIAARLLALADELARARGAVRMTLNAQTDAASVYARAGYVPVGEPFMEAGIEHIAMEKRLA
jgi:predicted GNAT family N-acyltransferase